MTREEKYLNIAYKLKKHFSLNNYNYSDKNIYIPKIERIICSQLLSPYLFRKTNRTINTYLVYIIFLNIKKDAKTVIESKAFYMFSREILDIKNIIKNDVNKYSCLPTDDIINLVYFNKINPISGVYILKKKPDAKDKIKESEVLFYLFYKIMQLIKILKI